MSVTASTGYILAQDGQLVAVNVPGTRLVSSRLRFKGKTIVDTWSNYNTGVGSASFPTNIPSGYTRTDGRAEFSVTITAGAAGVSGTVSVSAPGGSASEAFSIPANQSRYISVWADCYGYGTATGSISYLSGFGTHSGAYTLARVYAERVRITTSPKATVGAQEINGPATLADGVESGWYNITAGNLLPGSNQVAIEVSGSLQVWLEIEYTYDPYPPAPTRHTPENLAVSDDRAQPFEVTLEGAEGSSATQYHAKLVISQSPTLSNPIVADSSQSQVGWERWDGAAWVPLTGTGAAAGSLVRYTPTSPLPLGVLYWHAQTKDNWGYGLISSIWSLRVVLSVDSQEGYALAVDSVPYKCIDLEIKETSNGEIGLITFVIKNTPDAEGVRPFASIPYGASVAVALYDSTGFERQYLGRVWKKDPGDVYLTITATMGDRLLAERLAKQDYLEMDLGSALASIVTTECAPLQATGIPDPIGIVGSLAVKGKAALEAFQEAFRLWGLLFWTETAITDWVQYLRDPNTLAAQGVLIEYPPAPEEA